MNGLLGLDDGDGDEADDECAEGRADGLVEAFGDGAAGDGVAAVLRLASVSGDGAELGEETTPCMRATSASRCAVNR